MRDRLSSDVVVIGSGPGGAVSAALLAEAGKSVLLIEEGADLPLTSAAAFSRDEILQKYRNAGVTVALGRSKIAYVEGCCVGGGSEINRGLYHRTPADVLDSWRSDYSLQEAMPDDLEAHFSACERTARVEYLPAAPPLLSKRLHDGATGLGWSSIEAPRLYRYGKRGEPGRKQSMSETFIPRFRQGGGQLIANTRVTRLSRQSGKWRVDACHSPDGGDGAQLEISADTVFVAGGAVQTPSLLRRSGITRNIGNSLRFHPMLKVVAVFDHEVNRAGDLDPVHQVRQFEPRFGIGCSVSKRPALALALAGQPELLREVADNWERMAIYYVQHGGGRATVRNLPGWRDPLVRVSRTPADFAELAEGLRCLVKALFAAGAVAVYPCLPGYPALRSPDDIRLLPDTLPSRDDSATSVHVFSSCPMGENTGLCATDSYGRVHGTDGLYIADASLLCTPTVVNPQGTVMAFAHRNARHAIAAGFR